MIAQGEARPASARAEGVTAETEERSLVTSMEAALPGERRVDEALLDHVVQRLNATWQRKGLETACELGRIVLDTLFGGDLEAYRQRARRHISFRSLAARQDLRVSYTTLWNAVAVLAQLDELGEEIAMALPLSHHKALLPLADGADKRRLAKEAIELGLSKRALADRVRELRRQDAHSARGGRRPKPTFARVIGKVDAVFDGLAEADARPEVIEAWGIERTRSLLASADRRLAEFSALVEGLRGALSALGGERSE